MQRKNSTSSFYSNATHARKKQQDGNMQDKQESPNPPAKLPIQGIDFSDCVEKSDLIARAALHLSVVLDSRECVQKSCWI